MSTEAGELHPAREAASEFGVELLEIADLRALAGRASGPRTPLASEERIGQVPDEVIERQDEQLRAFVAMPFTDRFDDVFLLGIVGAAAELGMSAERADENLDSTEIIEYIKARIGDSDFVIVDTTEPNPNVFYELGYADGLGKDVLLIAAAGAKLPFDLRGRNHLLYKSIRDLRSALIERFERKLND